MIRRDNRAHTIDIASQGDERLGRIVFRTLPVTKASDYDCQPQSLLTFSEVHALAKQLRRHPAPNFGTVGAYKWREVGKY